MPPNVRRARRVVLRAVEAVEAPGVESGKNGTKRSQAARNESRQRGGVVFRPVLQGDGRVKLLLLGRPAYDPARWRNARERPWLRAAHPSTTP